MKSSASFEKINGKNIFQVFTEPETLSKKIVIMSHGFRGSSVGPARTFVDFTNLLLQEEFAVLRFDQPCGGNSEGDYIDSSFNEWVSTTTYFAEKYLEQGYHVALLGQSMGATTTMIVAGQEKLRTRIPCILLWVPDAKNTTSVESDTTYEEGGQKYKGKFWTEAKGANFFGALENYPGGIHLVYGESDKYISDELKTQTINAVTSKGQPCMVLEKQDHSSWDFNEAQRVYSEEITFLRRYFS